MIYHDETKLIHVIKWFPNKAKRSMGYHKLTTLCACTKGIRELLKYQLHANCLYVIINLLQILQLRVPSTSYSLSFKVPERVTLRRMIWNRLVFRVAQMSHFLNDSYHIYSNKHPRASTFISQISRLISQISQVLKHQFSTKFVKKVLKKYILSK